MYIDTLQDGTNPGGNLGVAFAANIGSTQIVPKGAYLDHLKIGISGTVGTAPVTIATALSALSQFVFKAGQETRIQLSGVDLLALHAATYGKLPLAWQNTDNTGSTFILGIKVPIWEKIDSTLTYTYSATYAAQTNFSAVKLAVSAVYLNTAPATSPMVAVATPFTTPGASGSTAMGVTLQNLGKLNGLLVFNTTAPSDGAALYDIQRITLVESGKQTSVLLAATPEPLLGIAGYNSGDNYGKTLQPYSFFDFSAEPFDVNTAFMQFIADVEVTSEATHLIPIITKA
ncbi:MAG: hypothetical protein ACREGR_03270 [Minisyncoccia bacterium]